MVALATVGCLSLMGSTASRLYKQGKKAEKNGAIAQAYILYSEAAAADPGKKKYRERAEALKVQAAIQAKLKPPSDTDALQEPAPDPETVFDRIAPHDLQSLERLMPPAELDLPAGLGKYDLKGDSKNLFEQVAGKLGLQVVFDGDYQPGQRVIFRMEDVSAREALHALELVTDSFIVPLSSRLIMVAKDDENRRKDLEQTEVVTVPIPSAMSAQDLTELGQIIRQTIGAEKIFWDSQADTIVIRDRVTRAKAAQALLHQLIAYPAQVALDLEFVEVSEQDMLDLGVNIQTSFPLVYLGTIFNYRPTIPSGLSGLLTFGGGKTLFGLGVVDTSVTAVMNMSDARSLLRTTIVSLEGKKATFHSGDKYPILTSGYFGGQQVQGNVFTPTPSYTFEDLGIVVNVTPQVHDMGEVSLELDTEYKVLGSGSFNGIPVISSRKLQSTMRLRNNQWALVAGIIGKSETRSYSGPAIISKIPFLRDLVSRFTRQKTRSYVLIAIKPRLLSLPPDQRVTRTIYLGSDTKTQTPL